MDDSKSLEETGEAKNRKQKRSLLTRENLLRSARAVFARDGFEHARIEDIASEAGKTRGAFYDNFKDKEDVFFAIFEDNISRDMAELTPRLLNFPEASQRIDAMAAYLSELSKNEERLLLHLEFKLYAIRHPKKRKRLADLHSLMCLNSCIPGLRQLIPQIVGPDADTQLVNSLVIGGIVDGLSLSHLFDPDVLSDEIVAHYLKLCLGEMIVETVPELVKQ